MLQSPCINRSNTNNLLYLEVITNMYLTQSLLMLSKYYDWYCNRNTSDTEGWIEKEEYCGGHKRHREPRNGCVDNKVKLTVILRNCNTMEYLENYYMKWWKLYSELMIELKPRNKHWNQFKIVVGRGNSSKQLKGNLLLVTWCIVTKLGFLNCFC